MTAKAPTTKSKTSAQKSAPKTTPKTTKAGARKAKPSWAETMKKALEKKQPAGGFPDQPKPRDSGVQKVRKNAF